MTNAESAVPAQALIGSQIRLLSRFPADFMFHLNTQEFKSLRSQVVISNIGRGGRRSAPYAFTELGVAMLSTVLNSGRAISVNIEIMRTFVKIRQRNSNRCLMRYAGLPFPQIRRKDLSDLFCPTSNSSFTWHR
jgi:hypothetical protein